MEERANKKKLIKNILEEESTHRRIQEQEENKPDLPERLKKPIRERKHSLGNHPSIPEDDDYSFEEKNLLEKYRETIDNYKKHHDVDDFKDTDVSLNIGSNTKHVMEMEGDHKQRLQELAVEMVRNEYDVPEDDIQIEANLMNEVESFNEEDEEESMSLEDIDVEDEEEKELVNKEVQKRRLVNTLIQGSALKSNHMFNLAEGELNEMNPRLSNRYAKLMSESDYEYVSGMGLSMKNNSEKGRSKINPVKKAGDVQVEFPENEGDTPKIKAQAVVFPILIHEIVKGVMEILSSHGLPDDPNIRNFVIEKGDKIDYEVWDLILGPCIWEKFLSSMEPEDVMDLKQYIYSDIVKLPPDEFNDTMREILGGTRKGKQYIDKISSDIRNELEHEEYEKEIQRYRDELGGTDDPNELDDM